MLCWAKIAKSKCRSFDSSAFSGLAQDDSAGVRFVLSHPGAMRLRQGWGNPQGREQGSEGAGSKGARLNLRCSCAAAVHSPS
jgi:hypothetical protein